MKVNLFDSHVHSENSPDANQAVTYICEQSIQRRIMGIAITDHFEADGDLVSQEKSIRQSIFDVERARTLFGGQLRISKGIELAQGYGHNDVADRILSIADYDFVLGSMHNTPEGEDYYFMDFNNPKIVVSEVLDGYYKSLVETARWGKFDALAHIRYPERYIWGSCRIPVDIDRYTDHIREIFKILIETGKSLEVNTSVLRSGGGPADPGPKLLKLYRQMGGELITLGSDAHQASAITGGFDDAMDMLLTLGYRYFAFYKERKPTMLRIL